MESDKTEKKSFADSNLSINEGDAEGTAFKQLHPGSVRKENATHAETIESGQHMIRLTVKLDYLLEPCIYKNKHYAILYKSNRTVERKAQEKKVQQDNLEKENPKKKRNPAQDYRKFYFVYNIGENCEGKTEQLTWDGNSWSFGHLIVANMNFLLDLYEKPIEFKLFEIIQTHILNTFKSTKKEPSMSKPTSTRIRIDHPLTNLSRSASINALAKRRFNLHNTSIPIKQRYHRKMNYDKTEKAKQQQISTLPVVTETEKFLLPTGEGYFADNTLYEKDFLTKITSKHSRSVSDLTGLATASTLQNKMKNKLNDKNKIVKKQAGGGGKNISRLGQPALHRSWSQSDIGSIDDVSESLKKLVNATTGVKEDETVFIADDIEEDVESQLKNSVFPSNRSYIKLENESRTSTQQYKISKKSELKIMKISEPTNSKPSQPKATLPNKIPLNVPNSLESEKNVSNDKERYHEIIDWTGKSGKPQITANPKSKKIEIKHAHIATITLDTTDLFLGELSVSAELEDKIDGIKSCCFRLVTDEPILSEEQAQNLNPMCITILHASGMPNHPIQFSQLDKLCLPVYTKFHFFDDPHSYISQTESPHQSDIVFKTRHLILPGLLDEDVLRDQLLNTKFEIEVHDRDYKLPSSLGTLFKEGSDQLKASIYQPKNRFGVASYSLVDLAKGLLGLKLTSPILPCKYTKEKATLPSGLWVESGATLSIKFDIKHPILSNVANKGENSLSNGIYSRIILVIRNDCNSALVTEIFQNIAAKNAKELKLQKTAIEDIEDLRLSLNEQESNETNLITGYNVFDDDGYVLFIEGPIEIIQNILNAVHSHSQSTVNDNSEITLFHNPKINYTQRIWMGILPGIVNIKLTPNLNEILKQTKTYIRNQVDSKCFEVLMILQKVRANTNAGNQPDQFGLLPSSKIIKSLVDKFGKIVLYKEINLNSDKLLQAKQQTNSAAPEKPVSLNELSESDSADSAQRHPIDKPKIDDYAKIRSKYEPRALIIKKEYPIREPNFVSLYTKKYPYTTQPCERIR